MTTPRPPELTARLCYVRDGTAWFSTDFDRQWGDDWNDIPYDCNAGTPYNFSKYMAKARAPYALVAVKYGSRFCTPSENDFGNVSVQDINAGCVPWLAPARYGGARATPLMGGATLAEFVSAIAAAGGTVYRPMLIDWGDTPEDRRGTIADVTP
jgi:hypothetical protein